MSLDAISQWLSQLPLPMWLVWLVVVFIHIGIILAVLFTAVSYLTLAERRIIGWTQVRIGPNRVGPFGFLQPIADGIKALFKEVVIPAESNRFLFLLAPILSATPAFAAWAVVPFDVGWVLADINVGLLFLLAAGSIGVYGVIIAGWASNSRYALLSAMRAAAQTISYEIPMGFALVGVVMAAGSLNLTDIVMAQQGGIWHWYAIPLLPLFIIYFICGVAETNRAPFDVVEGESELVAGFHVEYSGMAFALFFLAEYANMIMVASITTILFLGGWHSPVAGIPVVADWFAWVPGIIWFGAKVAIFLFAFLWLRATFPRYRYDQIMRLGWQVFLPISIFWIVVVATLKLAEVPPWW